MSAQDWLSHFKGRRVCITGAAGTVGRELLYQLIKSDASEIRLLDSAESALFELEGELDDPRVVPFVVDARDASQMEHFLGGVQDFIHAAAYKHVPSCERNPKVAIENNIIAVQNVITACHHNNVERALFTSSDKAVNPTNIMGTTKLMGERLFTAANILDRSKSTIFASTRFGNVLGSSGSVVPVFRGQIEAGKPISITDEAMTRFVMTPAQSAILVLRSLQLAKGGEVFVTKMPVVRITDLGTRMRKMFVAPGAADPGQRIMGVRPGEKLFEELMTEEEIARAHELDEFIVVLPAFRNIYNLIDYSGYSNSPPPAQVYRSDAQPLAGDDEIDALVAESTGLAPPATAARAAPATPAPAAKAAPAPAAKAEKPLTETAGPGASVFAPTGDETYNAITARLAEGFAGSNRHASGRPFWQYVTECNYSRSKRFRYYLITHERPWFRKQPLVLQECLDSGLVMASPRPDREIIYKNYLTGEGGAENAVERKRARPDVMGQHTASVRLAMKAHGGKPTRLFDMGCGAGTIMEAATQLGLSAAGNDINKAAIDRLNDLGLEAYCGFTNDLELPQNDFDIVINFDYLEHSYEPYDDLVTCNRILRNNGILHLKTLYLGCPEHILKGERYQLLGAGHFSYFPPETLASMVYSAGFEIEELQLGKLIFITARKVREPGTVPMMHYNVKRPEA